MGIERLSDRPVTDNDPLASPVGNSAGMRLASRASSCGAPAFAPAPAIPWRRSAGEHWR